jgi:hypothetical protein
VVLVVLVLALAACATAPPEAEPVDYRARAETQRDGGVSVRAAVLSPSESEAAFELPLASKHIQPVWLEITNQEDERFYLMVLSLDPDYFSPAEVAWAFRRRGREPLQQRIDRLLEAHVPVVVPPRSTVSGYVYTSLDPGAKVFDVELFASERSRSLRFAQEVPGFEADFMRVDFDRLYDADGTQDLDLLGLRDYLEGLPCCALGGDQETPGDPLNLVIVGAGEDVLAALVQRGWDLTETLGRDTVWRTIRSSVFGSRYRTSPVSPLYLFGRPQDVALQKARGTVDERNHLRLWLAPVTLHGESVWVGQISRDIGVKLSAKTLVTHKIDPIVDEARLYVALDLAASQALAAVGYVQGVGVSTREEPRFNYTGDPYYTDGLRVVLIVDGGSHALGDIEFLPWAQPGTRHTEMGPGEAS